MPCDGATVIWVPASHEQMHDAILQLENVTGSRASLALMAVVTQDRALSAKEARLPVVGGGAFVTIERTSAAHSLVG